MKNLLKHPSVLWLFFFLLLKTTIGISQPNTVEATINANETHEPISEYIYGQFVEHIGDIVNDGIWAEMIDSRKFYHPILKEKPETEDAGFRAPPKSMDSHRPNECNLYG